jgi:hypothetical protein
MRVRRLRARWLMSVACLAVAVPMLATMSASAQDTPAGSAAPKPSAGPSGKLEMNLTGNGSILTMGEPEIAVNPKNPKELYVDGATFPVPLIISGPSPAGLPNTCGGMRSENGGLTWLPASPPPTRCEDGVAVFGPDGTLYAGGDAATSTSTVPAGTPGAINVAGAAILVEGYDPLYVSKDGGRTWSDELRVMGSASAGTFDFAPGSGNPINTFDRPWLVVDQSTNTVYVAAHNIVDHQGFVTASTNNAKSFGKIYAIDSPDAPWGGFGGNIAAAHGILAAAYTASEAPGGTCPCVIFETSTDQGATFDRHVVPFENPSKQLSPYITADPTTKGHFALTILDATGTKNQVYVTADSGKTWHGPTLVGEDPGNQRFKPWLSFGPAGQLALVWRTRYSDSSYDVWAAVASSETKKGATFSAPVRVSSVAAPYPPSGSLGDDFSFIIPDRKYVHIGWGDSRNVVIGGGVQIWYARIPFASFKGESR